MSTLLVLEKWVTPISSEKPVGQDIRQTSSLLPLYYKIKDARNQARNIERKNQTGESDVDPQSQWEIVIKTAQEILQKHSKDLEVCAWLTEAAIRRYGFAGLAFGFKLMTQLIQQYWDQGLYPQEDDEGIEIRVVPIVGLNGQNQEGSLAFPIRNGLITAGSSIGPYSLWQYKQALDLENITNEKLKLRKIQEGMTSLEQIKTAVQESGADFYQKLTQDLSNAIAAFEALNILLREKCGHQAPPYSQITQVLEDFQDHLTFIVKEFGVDLHKSSQSVVFDPKEKTSTQSDVQSGVSAGLNGDNMTAEVTMVGSIRSREDAFATLAMVAQYFKVNEPHSPLSYSIERIIKWGKMPLPELMIELMDAPARDNFGKLTGVKTPTETKV